MFLSIFIATCRPKNIIPFLDNLSSTADDPNSFEVLIKVDEDDLVLIDIIERYRKNSSVQIKYIASAKLDGYYSLDIGYNELLKIADPNSYFCWLLTDEIRLETKGWDNILKKYIGFFPDDIFRIKLSIFQAKNHMDMLECLSCPDNYAVTTRKWLEITGGWGNFWGPDSWHQCVDFYLGLSKNDYFPYGIWRSFPIYDIKVGGQEAGVGVVNKKELARRALKIAAGWNQHSAHKSQENYAMLAQRLNAHIYAFKNNTSQYMLAENEFNKSVTLYSMDKKYLGEWSYKVPGLRIKLYTGYNHLTLRRVLYMLYMRYQNRVHTGISRALGIWQTARFVKNKIPILKSLLRKHRTKNSFSKVYVYDGQFLKCVEEKAYDSYFQN